MLRLRMFLACLLLVAIPLQGLAASSMLFCGQVRAPAMGAGTTAHVHSEHAQQAQHAHGDHDQHAGAAAQAAHDDGQAADPAQKCSVCAACCHSVAISEAPTVPDPALPSQKVPTTQPVAVHARADAPPDKPPRA